MTHPQALLLITTLLISAYSQATTNHSSSTNTSRNCTNINKIHNALAQNKAIAIIIDDNKQQNKSGADDSYADWQYYWETFIDDSKHIFVYFKLKSEELNAIIRKTPGSKGRVNFKPVSYLFFNRNRAFIYNEPIYEPQVYMYIQYSLTGKKIPEAIKPFKVDEIKIQLQHCQSD